MGRFGFTFVALCAALACLGVSEKASADNGPFDEIYSLLQQGEGVRVSLGLLGYHAEGLYRHIEDEPWETLFVDQLFEDDELMGVVDDCYPIDWINCSEQPELCADCNADTVPDCSGMCLKRNIFYYQDACVPPGLVTYRLGDGIIEDHMSIQVEDVGQECDSYEQWEAGEDDVAELELDAKLPEFDLNVELGPLSPLDPEYDSGCSVSGVGSEAGAGPVTACIMCLLGAIALALGRRKS